ncbi:MAG: radical SAM protein [Candidatus Nezhaarchaeota archaeon]|nr:radical SAM protein [Candidatus Nezhaarchaeota archaeon]
MSGAATSTFTIEVLCKTALSKSGIYGVDYSLNPYFGCEHSCIYCYVPRFTPHRLKGRRWGRFVEVKTNISKVLAGELKALSKGRILVSSVTDPYQPAERRYQLTRGCLELLAGRGFEVTVLTKSNLFTRDLDVIDARGFEVGVTVTTLQAYRELEPGAPPPLARLKALEEASESGFKTFLFLGPLIPGVVDEEVEELLELARASGVGYVIVDKLNTRGDVAQSILEALKEPQRTRFAKALAEKKWAFNFKGRIAELCRKLNLQCDFCF